MGIVLTPLRVQPSGERREKEDVFLCRFDLKEENEEGRQTDEERREAIKDERNMIACCYLKQ